MEVIFVIYTGIRDLGGLTMQEVTDPLRILKEQGLAAAIYTQISDVEGEVNGLMTYDRRFTKLTVPEMKRMNEQLLKDSVILKEIMPNSEKAGQLWKYFTNWEWIEDGWYNAGYDDRYWKEGYGYFGHVYPGTVYNTPYTEKSSFAQTPKTDWSTSQIWLRKEIYLDDVPENPLLYIWYYNEAEVYINGTMVLKVKGRTAPYPLCEYHRFIDGTQSSLKKGRNIIAVHCRRSKCNHIQAIDLGIYDVVSDQE